MSPPLRPLLLSSIELSFLVSFHYPASPMFKSAPLQHIGFQRFTGVSFTIRSGLSHIVKTLWSLIQYLLSSQRVRSKCQNNFDTTKRSSWYAMLRYGVNLFPVREDYTKSYFLPIQFLGPKEKGSKDALLSDANALFSGSHLSGWNPSGSLKFVTE